MTSFSSFTSTTVVGAFRLSLSQRKDRSASCSLRLVVSGKDTARYVSRKRTTKMLSSNTLQQLKTVQGRILLINYHYHGRGDMLPDRLKSDLAKIRTAYGHHPSKGFYFGLSKKHIFLLSPS